MIKVDVAIVGGGMNGAALALALVRRSFTVALLDAGLPNAPLPDGDMDVRVSTFSPASRNLLDDLGVWEGIAADRVQPFESMRVWENSGDPELVFEAADAGMPHLGYVAENRRVQGLIWAALGQSGGAELLTESRASSVDLTSRAARVILEGGESIRADLLVGADGARSSVREQADIDLRQWDYDQKGVVCTVETERSHERTAWQRFLPTGPLAFLPLANGRCSIVWSQPSAAAEACLEMDEDVFDAALSDAIEDRLGAVRTAGPRAAFPLRRQSARRYVGQRLALIGDAAHVIHPMAGQGVNLGFLDVASMVDVLVEGRARNIDLGDPGLLRRYERWRRSDNAIMADALHALKGFYAVDAAPVAALRAVGAGLLGRSRLARARLIEHASGFGGQVPAMVRPNTAL